MKAYAHAHPHTASLHCPAAAQGWSGIESLLQQLPGQQFELAQGSGEQGMPVERRQGSSKAAAEAAVAAASGKWRRVLVMFIGGVTYAEVRLRFLSFPCGWHDGLWKAAGCCATMQCICVQTLLQPEPPCITHLPHTWAASYALQVSALRFLSQKGLCNCDFLVATTAVCTGSSLLSSLLAQGGQQLASAASAPEA
jgi:hypothetical protein